MSRRRNSGLTNRHTTSLTSSTNFRSSNAICRATESTSGFRPFPVGPLLMTSSGKMALISGRHFNPVSASMNAVFRVVLDDAVEFSSCRLSGDRAPLARFVATKSPFFVDLVVKVSASNLRRFRSDGLFRLRLHDLLVAREPVLLTVKKELTRSVECN